MSKWPKTPKLERIRAKRYNRETGEWSTCDYNELKAGDIFEPIGPEGNPVHPFELEPIEPGTMLCRVQDGPEPSLQRGEGFQVYIEFGAPEIIMAKASN